jgi:hypothetical protein
MNEELSAGVNRLLFYFFILHSYFFICFWKPIVATVPPRCAERLAAMG